MSKMNGNTLELSDLALLKRAFSRADHEFINQFVYLTEDAISNRIEEVDPAWTFELARVERVGDQAVVCARLTIKGISREGVGMYKATGQAGEPEKSAATDALKRCARLFGIGRYLLNAPKEGQQFDRWLAEIQRAGVVSPPLPTQPAASSPNGMAERSSARADGDAFAQQFPANSQTAATPAALYAETKSYFNARAHFDNFISKHADALAGKTLAEAVALVQEAHWNWDVERCKALGATQPGMSSAEVLEALGNACGHAVKKWRDIDGLTEAEAAGALLAWVAGYDLKYVRQRAAEQELAAEIVAAAEQIAANYSAPRKETV